MVKKVNQNVIRQQISKSIISGQLTLKIKEKTDSKKVAIQDALHLNTSEIINVFVVIK
jgi:hypothetical protein